jgi:hypothetical protein
MAGGYQVITGGTFVATLTDPGGLAALGARVEDPDTRAVVSAWTQAALGAGVWTVTLNSPFSDGLYNLVWRTSDPDPPQFEKFIPISSVEQIVTGLVRTDWPELAAHRSDVTPTVRDVAQLIQTRTVGPDGVEVGTFTLNTRPTDIAATVLIQQGVDDIVAQLLPEIDPRHFPQVQRVVAFYSAMLIEKSYYPESAEMAGVLPWQAEYREALTALNARIDQDLAQQNLLGTLEPGPVLV